MRPIDADKLKKLPEFDFGFVSCWQIKSIIDAAPTIYMVGDESTKKKYTLKHGHWRIEPYLLEKTGCCSICGEQIRMPHEIYKYCPNCGTIMDGDSK